MKLKIDLDRRDIQIAIVNHVKYKYQVEIPPEAIKFDISVDLDHQTTVRACINA